MLSLKNNKGFTLIELMVVIVIISILALAGFRMFNNYLKGANDSARLTHITELANAISTYTSDYTAPPINQYALLQGEYIAKLPTDPANKALYQYNADIRVWNRNKMSRASINGGFLVASNRPLESADSKYYDGDVYAAKKDAYMPEGVKNLKYFGGYLVYGPGDASYLTDNGKTDLTSSNRYAGAGGGPSSAPAKCGSMSAGGTNVQLDPIENAPADFMKKTVLNTGLASVTEIYGATIPGSICQIVVKSDGKGTSVVDVAVDVNSVKGEGYADFYK